MLILTLLQLSHQTLKNIQLFEYAIRLGEKEGADLLIATDPDADRLGAAVRMPNGDYQVLTGNQLGSIMIHYILEAHQQAGTLPQNASVLKSIVSSELATAIAEKYNTKMFNVLTGFKFIAEKIQQYEEDHSQTFMFGFEESYGYLVKPFVRDKDAIQALVLLAEVAAFYKNKEKHYTMAYKISLKNLVTLKKNYFRNNERN